MDPRLAELEKLIPISKATHSRVHIIGYYSPKPSNLGLIKNHLIPKTHFGHRGEVKVKMMESDIKARSGSISRRSRRVANNGVEFGCLTWQMGTEASSL